jgi:hypothetical protein
MKRRTAALMFCRNNRKNISGSIIVFPEIKKISGLSGYWEIRNF